MPPSPAVATYNYLRLGLIALVVLLSVSVGYEFLVNDVRLGSISAYYYSPARSVFVGTLIGIGVALVAIKGRDTMFEDVLLNAAGMLAPIVALVPAAVAEGTIVNDRAVECPTGDACVPSAFEPGITNGAWSLGIVGVTTLVVVAVLAARAGRVGWGSSDQKRSTVGLGFATLVVAVFLALDVIWHDTYVQWGHYVAAVPMFIALTGAAVSNALQTGATVQMQVLNGVSFKWLYGALAVFMTLVLLGAAAYFLVTMGDADGRGRYWVFLVELLLLIPFTLFWILQTREWWDEGAPGLVADQPA